MTEYDNLYHELTKEQIIYGDLKPGMYIKAIPINPKLSKTTLFGHVIKIDIHDTNYDKSIIMIKFNGNKFITFKPTNYTILYKEYQYKSSTRKFFESLLATSDDNLIKYNLKK
jgi:hypothetical protein